MRPCAGFYAPFRYYYYKPDRAEAIRNSRIASPLSASQRTIKQSLFDFLKQPLPFFISQLFLLSPSRRHIRFF
jgi:hypothetical protein